MMSIDGFYIELAFEGTVLVGCILSLFLIAWNSMTKPPKGRR